MLTKNESWITTCGGGIRNCGLSQMCSRPQYDIRYQRPMNTPKPMIGAMMSLHVQRRSFFGARPGRVQLVVARRRHVDVVAGHAFQRDAEAAHAWAPRRTWETSPDSAANSGSKRSSGDRGYGNGIVKSPTMRPGRADMTSTRVDRNTAS